MCSVDAVCRLIKMIAFVKLGASRCMSLSMADTEVLSHKGPMAVGEVALIDLFRGI